MFTDFFEFREVGNIGPDCAPRVSVTASAILVKVPETKDIGEAPFRHYVIRMLIAKGKLNREMLALFSGWRRSSFHIFCRKHIVPNDGTALENLARYVIRASFFQERISPLANGGAILKKAETALCLFMDVPKRILSSCNCL